MVEQQPTPANDYLAALGALSPEDLRARLAEITAEARLLRMALGAALARRQAEAQRREVRRAEE